MEERESDTLVLERELFTACVERPAGEWEALLSRLCPDDVSMRQRVHRLLQRHLDTNPLENDVIGRNADDPDRIGPYRILNRLGEGGMGIVYAAEQREPVRRRVAVKVLRGGHNNREVLARFDAERQALALMAHPNIAHILDAGTTSDHRPFIVMEYVPGEPVTRYCRQRKLPLRDRLVLFRNVCDAVQHAHQRGVIHRDLKPSNILVMEEDGQAIPKIIDFGIAKAVTQRLTTHTLETKVGSLLGTPDYMSPEQAELSPLDVDTRTDIYALGAVLYELLAGVAPLQLAGSEKSYADMQRVISTQVPRPPSHYATGSLRRGIRGDLDWITLKALEKQRGRRYSSASEFGGDIDNHLAGLSILAGPPSRLRKIGKFVRRHWISSISAAAIMLTLAVSQWQLMDKNLELQMQRDRATAAARESEQVVNILAEIFEAVDPDTRNNESLSVTALLQQGFGRVLADRDIAAPVRARLLGVLGQAFLTQGNFSRAAEAYGAAIAGGYDESMDIHSFLRLHVRHAAAAQESGDIGKARQSLEQAERIVAEHGLAESPSGLSVRNALALHFLFVDDLDKAVTLLEDVLADYQEQLGALHERTLSTRHNLALALYRSGSTNRAREQLERVIADTTSVHGPDHSLVADASLLLGNVLRRTGDIMGARRHYTAAHESLSRLHGVDSGAALNARMGLALAYRGEPEGIALLEEVLAASSRAIGTDSILAMATAVNLADFLLDTERRDEAIHHAEPAYHVLSRIFGAGHSNTCEAAYVFAAAAAAVGRHAEAAAALEIAISDERFRARLPEDTRFSDVLQRSDYAKVRQTAMTGNR